MQEFRHAATFSVLNSDIEWTTIRLSTTFQITMNWQGRIYWWRTSSAIGRNWNGKVRVTVSLVRSITDNLFTCTSHVFVIDSFTKSQDHKLLRKITQCVMDDCFRTLEKPLKIFYKHLTKIDSVFRLPRRKSSSREVIRGTRSLRSLGLHPHHIHPACWLQYVRGRIQEESCVHLDHEAMWKISG